MSGKGSTPGISPATQTALTTDETALVGLAGQQASNAQQIYNLEEPGLQQSTDFYSSLASGDPAAIMRAIAPTAQATSQATAGAKANIMANDPAGGEKNLALELADVGRGRQIASTASGASLGAENALAKLGTQGIGLSEGAAGQAIGAYGAASQSTVNSGQLQLQSQQLQMEQKGQSLWPVSLLASGGTKGGIGGSGTVSGGGGGFNAGGGGGGGDFGAEGMDASGGLTFGGDTGSDFGTMGGAGAIGGAVEGIAGDAGVIAA
jgi:hypothetical protein